MLEYFFDYDDGDFIMGISDNTAMDSDGNLMVRMCDNMMMDMERGSMMRKLKRLHFIDYDIQSRNNIELKNANTKTMFAIIRTLFLHSKKIWQNVRIFLVSLSQEDYNIHIKTTKFFEVITRRKRRGNEKAFKCFISACHGLFTGGMR